jgi:hypothetical protein
MWEDIGTHYSDGIGWDYKSVMSDTYQDGRDNLSFIVDVRYYNGLYVQTEEPRSNPDLKKFVNYVGAVNGPFALISSFPEMDTMANYALRTAARTNPSRPVVDIPVEVLQIGELTRLIRKRGNDLWAELGKENLRFQFMIKPYVEDVMKLLKFHEHVARRVKELKRLNGPRGFRKTVKLDSWRRVDNVTITWSSAGAVIFDIPTPIERTFEIKGHARWKTPADMSKITEVELVMQAIRAVGGLTIDSATVWELIPWSWLIDWGYNVSAFFYANRNIVPAYLDSLSIIKHEVASANVPSRKNKDHRFNGGNYTIERKERIPTAAGFPTAHFPFLDGFKVGILASLYVTRR